MRKLMEALQRKQWFVALMGHCLGLVFVWFYLGTFVNACQAFSRNEKHMHMVLTGGFHECQDFPVSDRCDWRN